LKNITEKYFWEYPKLSKWCAENSDKKPLLSSMFKEIHGDVNTKLLEGTIKVIDKTVGRLYDHLELSVPYGFDLNEVSEKHNIILVPNHQSHADYVAITYLFYKKFKRGLHIAGGLNLNVFLIGRFFRKMGAFFIRRSFSKDIAYKLAFESYIYSLLKQNKILKFYFEGGRSRTGKLLSPRFGLFHMILEAHRFLENEKSLMFIPVSITHEYLPEEKAHAKELEGGKKKKETATQVLKIYKLFSKRLGSIFVKLGNGVIVEKVEDESLIKRKTQDLAFECFKAVGSGMPISPTSLLSLILLDVSSGVTTWEEIEVKAQEIIDFASRFNIPLTPLLEGSFQEVKYNIHRALNILIGNGKVSVIQNDNLGDIFYSVKSKERIHLLYFKNMILHHFLVPCFMNTVFYHLKNKRFADLGEFRAFMTQKREELKFEFYLPSEQEMFQYGIDIVCFATGREIESLEECFELSLDEIEQVQKKIIYFGSALSYINECYFLSAKTLLHIGKGSEFDREHFMNIYKEIYKIELQHGRVIQFVESFLVPVVESSLKFYQYSTCVEQRDNDKYIVSDVDKLEAFYRNFASDLNTNVIMNLKSF